MPTTILGLSNVIYAYTKQKLFKLGTHLTARNHFTETTVISTYLTPLPPPSYYQFEWSREKDKICKNYSSFFPRGKKTHILSYKPVLSLGEICNSLHYFLFLQVIHTFFFFRNKLPTLQSKKDTCTYSQTHMHTLPLAVQEGFIY